MGRGGRKYHALFMLEGNMTRFPDTGCGVGEREREKGVSGDSGFGLRSY